jgi:hypothetical protein
MAADGTWASCPQDAPGSGRDDRVPAVEAGKRTHPVAEKKGNPPRMKDRFGDFEKFFVDFGKFFKDCEKPSKQKTL